MADVEVKEDVLKELNLKLSALGDLDKLVSAAKDLPTLTADLELKKSNIEEFLKELPNRNTELTRLSTETNSLIEQVKNTNTDIAALAIKNKDLQDQVEKLIIQTQTQLGAAADQKLANTFSSVKDELVGDRNRWFKWLVAAVIILVVATASLVYWQIQERRTLYDLSILVKLALTSPFVYFVIFINREFNRSRNLIEEYAFKAAIARSFDAYKEIIIFAEKDATTKTFDFVKSSITDIYSSPMVNIKNNSMNERELSPEIILSQLKVLLDKIPSIDKITKE